MNILRGDLKDFSFYDILTLIKNIQKSGVLIIESEGEEFGRIYFDQGEVTHASVKNSPILIGSLLVKHQKIDEEELERILNENTGGKLGEKLVKSGAIEREELRKFLKLQLVERCLHMFLIKDGSFKFIPNEKPKEINIKMDVDELMLELTRKYDELMEIRKVIPNDDIVLKVNPEPNMDSLTFSKDEWEIVFMCDGIKTVGEIAWSSKLGYFEALKTMRDLINSGLLLKEEEE